MKMILFAAHQLLYRLIKYKPKTELEEAYKEKSIEEMNRIMIRWKLAIRLKEERDGLLEKTVSETPVND